MREVHVDEIIAAVEKLCIEANIKLPEDVKSALNKAVEKESSPLGREILHDIIKNYQIAEEKDLAICQDTGFAVFFVRLGQDVRIIGGNFNEAINEGVRRGYKNGYLRKSIVNDPLIYRKNTGDNTPAIIHLEIVPGDKIQITFAPKGGGSENMSALRMLKPSDGVDGLKKFVLETVRQAGPNPCPPIIVGVGIGGTIEVATLIAKKALLRPIGEHHPMPEIAELEKELLEEVNKLGIGPQGFGGKTTALAVNIETFPAHIASLPVAINIQCHVARHKEVEI
ncbi:fumarate hydratase subunit alpha [Caldanaerovirga acetigignens]|uniref:Fumarate hydratase subunit alpha n=1 Tax=Caldanaerovirga acetigignens TaxID=447595 RepID=A0A1M7I960_9FIRM|nr:fumarate hydratase [Caldanaerovirga acetigignens]SHM37302.1 fumarate hydratase subunit alpha [Caldanaerovirga acetigignens]